MPEAAGDDGLIERLEDGVRWIVMNRPDVQNALTQAQRNRMIELFEDASENPAVRCVVLTGTGKGFCTGADLRASAPPPPRPEGVPDRIVGDVARNIRRHAQRFIAAVLDCEKPVIAAVNGTAAGMGAHLALACDLVIAAESARFIEVFVRRGLVPDAGGAYLLPRLVGPQRAKELLFFGDTVDAARAEQLGLVNRVVPDAELEAAAAEWAARLAAGPTRSLAFAKALVNRSLESDRATLFDAESWFVDMAMTTHDSQEGVAAFVERRDVAFRGW